MPRKSPCGRAITSAPASSPSPAASVAASTADAAGEMEQLQPHLRGLAGGVRAAQGGGDRVQLDQARGLLCGLVRDAAGAGANRRQKLRVRLGEKEAIDQRVACSLDTRRLRLLHFRDSAGEEDEIFSGAHRLAEEELYGCALHHRVGHHHAARERPDFEQSE